MMRSAWARGSWAARCSPRATRPAASSRLPLSAGRLARCARVAASRRWGLAGLTIVIAVTLPVRQTFAITTTGNPFLVAAVAGGSAAIAGLGVALALRRWGYPWLVEQIRRLPWPSARRLLLGDAA